MSKDDENPMEEIQKQLRDLFKNKNVQVAFAPFMQSMNQAVNDKDDGDQEAKESPTDQSQPWEMH